MFSQTGLKAGSGKLLTGGGSGIGRGLAEALHRRGNEILVESAQALRNNPGPNEHALVTGFNEQLKALLLG